MKEELGLTMLLHVLSLEDDLKDAELLKEKLVDVGYNVTMDIANSEKQFADFLKAGNYDIIIADNSIPQFDAFAALNVSLSLRPEIPFICVSGTVGEERAVEMLKQGASDYVIKDRLERFSFAVRRALKEKEIEDDRKKAEEKIQESEAKYRNLVENAPDAIIIHQDKKIVFANRESLRLVGAKRVEDLKEKSLVEFVHPGYRSLAIERIKTLQNEGSIVAPAEEKFLMLDGREIDVEVIGMHISYEHKPAIQLVIRDITERKNSEKALVESKKIAESYLNVAADVIMSLDTLGNIILINDSGCKLLGYKKEELIGKNWFRTFVPLELSGELISLFEKLLNGDIKKTENYENPVKTRSGDLKTILWHNSLRTDMNGKITGTISSGIDITERKQAELALIKSEQKSRSIMENSADAIFIANQQGKYVYTNKAVSAMLGYTPEEMLNKTIADITPPGKGVETFDLFKQIMNEGKGFTEIELIKKDGSYIPTDLNAVVLPDGTIYGSCRDMTEHKQAEFELIKAKEKAEESDRLKSAFLANMSHEIRTPMNGILGFAGLLKNPNLSDEKQQEFIKIIRESGNRMLDTINNIVDISKIEAGLMTFYISRSNINKQIEFLHEFFSPMAESKGLQLSFNNGLPLNESIIETDSGKINSILTNLVKNAIKFTVEGSIEFGYKKKGGNLEFFVKDTGIGIPEDRREAIFERFIQADIDDKRAFQGSGLGLSISESYVEKLGGRIWVESEEGKGSIFYFTLPYNAVSNSESLTGNAVSEEDEGVGIKDLKILIVEDEEASALFITTSLEEFYNEVIHASTGVEAIEACRNHPEIDLVLMDIRMPEMDGYEATRQIRLFNKDVIIIAQTAYAFVADIEKAMDAGCNDYISKPIKMTLLHELIKKHCNKQKINT